MEMRFFGKNNHRKDDKDSDIKSLYHMQRGQKGVVVNIQGGHIFKMRLSDIGIREDKVVTKVCNQPLHGPVQVKVDNTEIALGRHMAMKIEVKCLDSIKCEDTE